MRRRAPTGIGGYLSGIVAGIWVALAWRNPENTYYIAPLLAAAAFPISQRVRLGRLSWRDASWAAAGGLVNALVATGLLLAAGKFDGKAVLGFWHPAVEAVAFGVVGAVVGAWAAQVRAPASLVRR